MMNPVSFLFALKVSYINLVSFPSLSYSDGYEELQTALTELKKDNIKLYNFFKELQSRVVRMYNSFSGLFLIFLEIESKLQKKQSDYLKSLSPSHFARKPQSKLNTYNNNNNDNNTQKDKQDIIEIKDKEHTKSITATSSTSTTTTSTPTLVNNNKQRRPISISEPTTPAPPKKRKIVATRSETAPPIVLKRIGSIFKFTNEQDWDEHDKGIMILIFF